MNEPIKTLGFLDLPETKLLEDTLMAEMKLFEGALGAEMKLLEGALEASAHQWPFQLSEFKPPDAGKLAENFSKIITHSQHLIQEYLRKQFEGEIPFRIPDPGIVAKAFLNMFPKLVADPAKIVQAQANFWQEYLNMCQIATRRLLGEKLEPAVKPAPGDKRFKDPVWAENAVFDFIKQSYLLVAHNIYRLFTGVEGLDPKTAEKIDFYTRQFVDAISPTNFALTNPQVVKTTLETGGENLVKGLANLLDDLERGKGRLRIKQTKLETFELGRNLAVTPGKVIYQTELMQLLQYNPVTEQVYQRPLLIIPPWINKYYILDLQPKNSLVKWATEQGFTVFVVSWVNPDERLAEINFEDYMAKGTLAALDAIKQATGEDEINAVGYCIGGTLLFCTLAYMTTKNDTRIKSATAFTTMLDFTHVGEMSVFIDEEQFAHMDRGMARKGYLEGYHMAGVFNLMRSNDLIWSFVVKNYLLGQEPFPFDLLYWNSDCTRMPKAMHAFYLRNMYLHNRLRNPGGVTFLGVPLDLGKIETPAFFLSAKEDHIAPWKGTYAGTHLVGGPVQFVLGESGHIAGVVNPPAAKKYGYWTNDRLPATPEEWFETATHHEGSWWTHWLEWVKPYAGPRVPARVPGDGALTPIEDAPGAYVKVPGVD
ncbi:MAG: class I poly(R)-hydroxyalkanoic acid synthase [Candidatus Competibacteraceae bacterium]